MTEHPDDLTRLRHADPLDPASLPSPADPAARALFARITAGPVPGPSRGPLRRWVPVAIGVAAAVGVIALSRAADDPEPTSPGTTGVAQGPITPGGPSMGSCVELYDLQTLAQREIAFDGTVDAVDGDAVRFVVNRWFRGGDTADVTLAGAEALAGLTSAASESTPLEPGTRLLVAGDGGFAWGCGFTQPYSGAVADEWEAVFGG